MTTIKSATSIVGVKPISSVRSLLDNVFFYAVLLAMSLVMVVYTRIKNWIETQRIIRTYELIAPRDEEDINQ